MRGEKMGPELYLVIDEGPSPLARRIVGLKLRELAFQRAIPAGHPRLRGE